MKKVVGLGAGGHAKVVMDILRLMGGYEIIGLLDSKRQLWQSEVLGVPVLGGDSLLIKLREDGVSHAFIGLGTIGDPKGRISLYETARKLSFEIVDAIHPSAIISSYAEVGYGATIMANAVINASAKIGDDVIVNTGSIIEHDCTIDNHVHIATGARLASTVSVGEGSHIGIGASVRQCITIGRNALIGAGSVVVDDIPDNAIACGVPAKVLRLRGGV